MKTFVLFFGAMVGDLINEKNDENWKLYKLLRTILCAILRFTITKDTPHVFKALIT